MSRGQLLRNILGDGSAATPGHSDGCLRSTAFLGCLFTHVENATGVRTHSLYGSCCSAAWQQKPLPSPRSGASEADLPTRLPLRRTFVFTDETNQSTTNLNNTKHKQTINKHNTTLTQHKTPNTHLIVHRRRCNILIYIYIYTNRPHSQGHEVWHPLLLRARHVPAARCYYCFY